MWRQHCFFTTLRCSSSHHLQTFRHWCPKYHKKNACQILTPTWPASPFQIFVFSPKSYFRYCCWAATTPCEQDKRKMAPISSPCKVRWPETWVGSVVKDDKLGRRLHYDAAALLLLCPGCLILLRKSPRLGWICRELGCVQTILHNTRLNSQFSIKTQKEASKLLKKGPEICNIR